MFQINFMTCGEKRMSQNPGFIQLCSRGGWSETFLPPFFLGSSPRQGRGRPGWGQSTRLRLDFELSSWDGAVLLGPRFLVLWLLYRSPCRQATLHGRILHCLGLWG